jgi:ubiquinone/menaquinone biosynthesis C-methylase UbiE
MVPAPKDGTVNRILDIGCSIGQFATAMKDRFPEAEVTGIDIGEPMVRYAHKRALDMGREVTFMQGLIESSGFPDNHFDIITSFIVFHEMPPEISKQIIAEVKRMLRPGGIFAIIDFPAMPMAPPLSAYFVDFDHRDNCEPFTVPFMMSDLPGTLTKEGFTVEMGPPTFAFLETRICTNTKAA